MPTNHRKIVLKSCVLSVALARTDTILPTEREITPVSKPVKAYYLIIK